MSNTDALRACPFCGSEAVVTEQCGDGYSWQNYYEAYCTNMDCGTTGKTAAEAAELWNRRAALAEKPAPDPVYQAPAKLWLWKNFVDGRPEYWAFDNPFPVHLDCGDPQTLGEPAGYALFKTSRTGRTDVSDAEVLKRIQRFESTGKESEPNKTDQGHQAQARRGGEEPPVRRVVCAAIRASDGRLVLGIRHYSHDMHEQIARRDDRLRFQHLHDPDQGFVDQFGVYMTREEAYQVAAAAGQILHPESCGEGLDGPKLYSEGLY